MSQDPYHAVQLDVETSLQSISTLRASYLRIRSTARGDSEELAWARNELNAILESLDADVEDLEESVRIVESTGARLFGLEDSEVSQRRAYVHRVKRELKDIRAELEGRPAHSRKASNTGSALASGSKSPVKAPASIDDKDTEDHQSHWAQEEQQMMIREQDRTMDSIVGTLSTLAQQAGLMGQEILVHNELLEDLEEGVTQADSKLAGSMKRLKKFVRQTEESRSGCCIILLIIVLCALLLAVILI